MKASFIFAMLLLSGAAVGCSSLEGEKDAKADAKRQVIDKEIEADRFASMLKNVQFIDGKAWTHFAFPINADRRR